eukprot:505682_1
MLSSFLETLGSNIINMLPLVAPETHDQFPHSIASHFRPLNNTLGEELHIFCLRNRHRLTNRQMRVTPICNASHIITQYINGTMEADVTFIHLICVYDCINPVKHMFDCRLLLLEIIWQLVLYSIICSSILSKQDKQKYFVSMDLFYRGQMRSVYSRHNDIDMIDFIFSRQFTTIPAKTSFTQDA